jgi:hypothetical protein
VNTLLECATAPFKRLMQSIQARAVFVRFGFLVLGGQ